MLWERKRETPATHRRLHPMETARCLPVSIRPPLAGFESWVISLITHSCENSSLIPAFLHSILVLCRAGARRSQGDAEFESLSARKCFSHEKRCFLLHFMTERADATIEELYQRLITIPYILFADL